MTTIGERIRLFRKFKGYTGEEFGKIVGVSQGSLSELENNKAQPKGQTLQAIIRHTDISADWLIVGEGEMLKGQTTKLENVLPVNLVPVLGTIRASFPEIAPEDVIDRICVPQAPDGSFAYIIARDNMSPTVRIGDYAIFVAGAEAFENGDVILARDEWGEVWIRRLREKDGQKFLVSDNPEYSPVAFQEQQIIGKVVDTWRRVRL